MLCKLRNWSFSMNNIAAKARSVFSIYSQAKIKFFLNRIDPDLMTTYFEGGLGSQLMAYIEHHNKSKMFGSQALVDVSYFDSNEIYDNEWGLTHWIWKLDHYGIDLPITQKVESKLMSLRRPNDAERARFILENNLLKVDKELLLKLPVLSNAKRRNEIFFSKKDIASYGVIHVRNGDFLRVSSRLIEVEELKSLLHDSKNMLPKIMIFITDGLFSEYEKAQIRKVVGRKKFENYIFFDKANEPVDETLVHDLMRCAKLLITSNSTFSFTAGMLNVVPDSMILFPITFYGESSRYLNSIFRNKATFGVLER